MARHFIIVKRWSKISVEIERLFSNKFMGFGIEFEWTCGFSIMFTLGIGTILILFEK